MPAGPGAAAQEADGRVAAVSRRAHKAFSKANEPVIALIAGEGVAGDAHCGRTVRHRSRVAKNPSQLNLRQPDIMHAGLLKEARGAEFDGTPGAAAIACPGSAPLAGTPADGTRGRGRSGPY